ncbi:MAG: DUF3596 domain-containing protein [Silanimonas sp.]|nr:DUF3596 domain-containing protein [Silanimonas sp.]
MLYLDFTYRTVRCKEQTALADTPGNRKTLEAFAKRIDKEIRKGTFNYAEFFPDSSRAARFNSLATSELDAPRDAVPTPSFGEFAELWEMECVPRWRVPYRTEVRKTLERIILPAIGSLPLSAVDRAVLLGFQAEFAKRPGHKGNPVSAKRINKVMGLVKTILNEGCDRYGLQSAGRSLKRLKQRRTQVMPFSLDEVDLLISKVRKDYAPYLTVRLLTGLRPGEAHGLQWRDVDLAGGVFHIVRTLSRKGDGQTKTEGSRRTIPMVPLVRAAFEAQKGYAIEGCPWVFHTIHGNPIDSVNFTNRIWYPLLRHLGLEPRVPYQMRHTAATLMLAAGENPEWVATVLGHSTTEMLFRVYSRFVPNITRNDGTAFAGLVNGHITPARAPLKASIAPSSDPPSALDLLNGLSPQELSDLIAKIKSTTALPTP